MKAIKATVQETLAKVASEVTDADYTIAGIEEIKKDADVSKPVTLTVKANADSTKITGDSKSFAVTFKSDQEVVTAIKTAIDSLQGDDLKVSPIVNTENAAKNAVEKVIDGKIKLNTEGKNQIKCWLFNINNRWWIN
ncbi:hypothetical protein P344_02460 [Spiroplasma mirum ATCC 29335]|uniref:Uncharacterized protein n=1 Tax=Spiroplasma mirum ATCC 29335 TaxID=838561 RepID=W0GQE8_9MOLU|nr:MULTISPECIES: hypothetical protein [Spiroplasma]AHF60854.1 hypothetical protein SMM_0411 [Spiroplasma mirum ATCC 29335]AHI57839.1 hypothetical protein P344_02460 [Spiroplasma mirum ATCC 29335]AKM52968.1 hypothetical protein SATRI_v1c04680 [Spiroplasma atrichopogonis]